MNNYMTSTGVEIPGPKQIMKNIIETWDIDYPTRSLRERHLQIARVFSDFANGEIEQLINTTVNNVKNYYNYLQKGRMCSNRARNTIGILKKLLFYVDPNKPNPYAQFLSTTNCRSHHKKLIIKPKRAMIIKDNGSIGNVSLRVQNAVLEGILTHSSGLGINPTKLHKKLFEKKMDISHTMRACQALEQYGYLSSTIIGPKKYYRATGKQLPGAYEVQKQDIKPSFGSGFSKYCDRDLKPDTKIYEKNTAEKIILQNQEIIGLLKKLVAIWEPGQEGK